MGRSPTNYASNVNYALNVGKARDTAVTVPSPARRRRICPAVRSAGRSHGHQTTNGSRYRIASASAATPNLDGTRAGQGEEDGFVPQTYARRRSTVAAASPTITTHRLPPSIYLPTADFHPVVMMVAQIRRPPERTNDRSGIPRLDRACQAKGSRSRPRAASANSNHSFGSFGGGAFVPRAGWKGSRRSPAPNSSPRWPRRLETPAEPG